MDLSDLNKIKLTREQLDQVIQQAITEKPNECCGYMASKKNKVYTSGLLIEKIYPLTNKDSSPTHFTFYPKEQFRTVKDARELDLNLTVVYHSHPDTPARMSEEDLALAFDEGVVYIIYSLFNNEINGFTVKDHKVVNKINVEVVDE